MVSKAVVEGGGGERDQPARHWGQRKAQSGGETGGDGKKQGSEGGGGKELLFSLVDT